jgi:ABC-2 type transport system permease protein
MSVLVDRMPLPGFWPSVWKLLRLRLLIFLTGFRKAKTSRKIGMIFLGLLILGMAAFIFTVSWLILRFISSAQFAAIIGDVRPVMESMPTLVLSGAFIGILFTSFGVLLQALYLSGDMDFLLTVPIPIRAVFFSKLLQAILPNFGLICLFALPVLFGLGLANQYSILYYPLVILVIAALALAASGLSALLVMFVVRIFPARRVAEVLGFLGAILSFTCSQSGQFARFGDMNSQQTAETLESLTRFTTPASPLAWPGLGLVRIGEGRWLEGLGFSGLALAISVFVFALALTTAERLYYSGWASMQGVRRKKKPIRSTSARKEVPTFLRMDWVGKLVPQSIRALIRKDFIVLRRDIRNMSNLITPLIFGTVYAVMLLRPDSNGGAESVDGPEWVQSLARNAGVYTNIGLSMFVGWMLLARLAGAGISQEGKSYWVLKTAPISSRQLLSAKFLVAFLPTIMLELIFMIVLSLLQKLTAAEAMFNLLVIVLCTAGNTGINLGFGVYGARLDWEDPRQMMQGGSGCLAGLAQLVYLPICLGLFFGPAFLIGMFGGAPLIGSLVGLVLGGALSIACATIPLLLVRERLLRLGE